VYSINQKITNKLVKLLVRFIERKTGTLSIKNRSNAELVYYYYEIIRYWNKINFILKRNLKFTNKPHGSNNYGNAKYLIAIYRIVWEKENALKVGNELNFSSEEMTLIKKLENFSWKQALKGKNELERLSLEIAIPTFTINRLAGVMDIETIRANIKQMDGNEGNQTFFFRLNDLPHESNQQDSINFILKDLEDQGINTKRDTHFSKVFYTELKNKKKIILSKPYKEGKLVIHDKASFAVAHLLEPQANELICDLCAAPGISQRL